MRYQIIETMYLGKTKYVGRIKLSHCYDQEEVVDRMVERDRSLSRETFTAALMVLKSTVKALCREGNAVRLDGFVRFSPTLCGTFHDQQDLFDHRRHVVTLTASVAKPMHSQLTDRLSMHRVNPSEHRPEILSVEDHETGTKNQAVTRGAIVSLRGQRLRFDPQDPRESLSFQNADDRNQEVPILKPVRASSKEL